MHSLDLQIESNQLKSLELTEIEKIILKTIKQVQKDDYLTEEITKFLKLVNLKKFEWDYFILIPS